MERKIASPGRTASNSKLNHSLLSPSHKGCRVCKGPGHHLTPPQSTRHPRQGPRNNRQPRPAAPPPARSREARSQEPIKSNLPTICPSTVHTLSQLSWSDDGGRGGALGPARPGTAEADRTPAQPCAP